MRSNAPAPRLRIPARTTQRCPAWLLSGPDPPGAQGPRSPRLISLRIFQFHLRSLCLVWEGERFPGWGISPRCRCCSRPCSPRLAGCLRWRWTRAAVTCFLLPAGLGKPLEAPGAREQPRGRWLTDHPVTIDARGTCWASAIQCPWLVGEPLAHGGRPDRPGRHFLPRSACTMVVTNTDPNPCVFF